MLKALMLATIVAAPALAARDVQAIVRALEARYHSAGTLEAVFLERYSDGRQGIRVESGTVYFSRPGRMRWEYESPETKLFLVDGKHVWFYVPDDRTASRADLKQSEDWRTPFALLTGKVRLSRLCGSIAIVAEGAARSALKPEERPTSAGNVVLRCSPKGEGRDAAFREVLFEVDPENRLARVLIREPGNVETEFRFGNWQENIAVPESKFHFEPPVGVAIVDEARLAGAQP
jgi:outer membrane lipoprotein carrier protein